jgi:acetyl-CoA/propionyl-CoA carboxylase biotin carboxyl carrier protein
VRVDSGVEPGSEVTPLYDPMVAKLIVWDVDREHATARMLRALGEYEIEGLQTLIPFHQAILATQQWAEGSTCRELTEDKKWLKTLAPDDPLKTSDDEQEPPVEKTYKVEVGGKLFPVRVIGAAAPDGAGAGLAKAPKRSRAAGGAGGGGSSETLSSPLQGTVLKVAVKKGDSVEEGALICVIEAMKMENEITAHRSGKVAELGVTEGGSVANGDPIVTIK